MEVMVLVGECKERMNRVLGGHSQTYIVGSFEESILLLIRNRELEILFSFSR